VLEWWCRVLDAKKGEKLNCLIFWHFLDTYLVCRMIISCVRLQHLLHSPNRLTRDNILVVHAIQQWVYYLAHPGAAPKVLHGGKLSWTPFFLMQPIQWLEVFPLCLNMLLLWRYDLKMSDPGPFCAPFHIFSLRSR
jgi:hypothetical protein